MATAPEKLPANPGQYGPENGTGWIATSVLIGASLASACCVVPLVLVTLGISGAWIANLTALEPYKPYVAAVTLALLGYGFWHVYFKPAPPCADGSYCAIPQSKRNTKIALWVGLVIVIIALSLDWWAPLFY